MHPDQEIFHSPKGCKVVKYVAIVVAFSAFSLALYGVFGKHFGPTTTVVVERKDIKKKDKKFAYSQGYKRDSNHLPGLSPK